MPNIKTATFVKHVNCAFCGQDLYGTLANEWSYSPIKKIFFHKNCYSSGGSSPAPLPSAPPSSWKPPQVPPITPTIPQEPKIPPANPIPTPEPVIAPSKPKTSKTEHCCFERLLQYMKIRRDDGHHEDIYIPGAPGSGKSYAIKQAAKKLDLRYAYIALSEATQPSQIFGYCDANGKYVETLFYQFYKDGGVLDIAELDNTNHNIFTLLNNALDNGNASFPCGMIERHKDFIAVGNGNTDLRGPSDMFPGRQKQDAASIARFTFLYDWDYDPELELSLFAKHEKMVLWVQKLRQLVTQREDKLVAGTREMRKIAGMLEAGIRSDIAVKDGLFKNYQATKELLLLHPLTF